MMNLIKNRREFLLIAAATPLALLEGCAKVPSAIIGGRETRFVTVTMRVAGRIRQTSEEGVPYSYFFVVNFVDSVSESSGPIPQVIPPWNTGFAAPDPLQGGGQGLVGFVLFSTVFNGSRYLVYEVPIVNGVPRNAALLGPGPEGFEARGTPDRSTVPAIGDNMLVFRLNLNIFRTFYRNVEGTNEVRLPNFLQFNFINTDRFPVDPNDNGSKLWDALGNRLVNTASGVVTVPLNQTQSYNNTNVVSINPNSVEVSGDVWDKQNRQINEPDLDIVEWSVQITSS